jgi:hypothetical protein
LPARSFAFVVDKTPFERFLKSTISWVFEQHLDVDAKAGSGFQSRLSAPL